MRSYGRTSSWARTKRPWASSPRRQISTSRVPPKARFPDRRAPVGSIGSSSPRRIRERDLASAVRDLRGRLRVRGRDGCGRACTWWVRCTERSGTDERRSRSGRGIAPTATGAPGARRPRRPYGLPCPRAMNNGARPRARAAGAGRGSVSVLGRISGSLRSVPRAPQQVRDPLRCRSLPRPRHVDRQLTGSSSLGEKAPEMRHRKSDTTAVWV